MTASPNEPHQLQSMLDWMESELRQVKGQLTDFGEQAEQNRAQAWDAHEQVKELESRLGNMSAQMNMLTVLNDQQTALRERVDRLQGLVGQDEDELEALARRLRAEIQSDRDENKEVRHRAEFAEQAALNVASKMNAAEEVLRRMQDDLAILHQRMEQADINLGGCDARVAANAETVRRIQANERHLTSELERYERLMIEFGERSDRMQEQMRRHQEAMEHFHEMQEQFEVFRDRLETMRQASEELSSRATAIQSGHGVQVNKLGEQERGLERMGVRLEQQERCVAEVRVAVDETREGMAEETERFLALQEKIRRRRIDDLEQEIRELKGPGRPRPRSP